MKHLLKHEWKYYLLFFIAMLAFLIIGATYSDDLPATSQFYELPTSNDYSALYSIGTCLWLVSTFTKYNLNVKIIIDVLIVLALFKLLYLWQERESSGREFLCSLPVTKTQRWLFHLVMDSGVIILSVSIYTWYIYSRLTNYLQSLTIELPWLGQALFGEMITCIAYLLFLLGVIYVLETFFVDGFIRVIGTGGSLYLCYNILSSGLTLNKNATWMQNIYGFFLMEKPGGGYYDITDHIGSGGVVNGSWSAVLCNRDVYYQGTTASALDSAKVTFSSIWTDNFSDARLTNFCNVNSYIGYAIAYLVFGLLFMGLSLYLANRQELSRQGFFFPAGRYVFCLLLACGFAGMMMTNSTALWHRVLIVLAGVLLYLILNYFMKPERKKLPH